MAVLRDSYLLAGSINWYPATKLGLRISMNEMARIAREECIFDETFYLACYGDLLPKKMDPLSHFNKGGWKMGFNPNPFFSTAAYLEANPDAAKSGGNPFQHFTNTSSDRRPFASPVFDAAYYISSSPDIRFTAEAVTHYWKNGRLQGRSPSALFDISHYRAQLREAFKDPVDYLAHYLTIGWKLDLSPHPLFDPDYYRSQLSGPATQIAPLVHYLEAGWRRGLSPHPLFDPAYYVQNTPEASSEPPLVHYLKRSEWIATPHYLFSDTFYIAAVERSSLNGSAKDYRGGPPLLHYCRTGVRHDIPPHPLFDLRYYTAQAQRAFRDIDDLEDARIGLSSNPLKHYCQVGFGMGLSPTPLFDQDFYRSQFSDGLTGDPLRHYLSAGFSFASPHPAIDLDFYASQAPEFLPHELPVILDLLMTGQNQRVSTHPSFDPKFYLERNRDVRDAELCPILHFLEHGMKEARQPNALFSYPYAHRLCRPDHKRFGNPVDGYFRARGNERTRVLFLGHDASRSGAPLVLLALVKQLSQTLDIECVTVLGEGGPLVDDFVGVSLTYVAQDRDREYLEWSRHSPAFRAEMSAIAALLEDNPPALVVCNSLESRHLADYFVSCGFGPLVTLVHEVADPYDGAQISRLLDASDLSVFVSEYQLNRMRKKLVFDESAVEIVRFGAIDGWFGSGDRALARRNVRAALGLSNDARIVLGCGTMNFRKGVDLFAEVASEVLSRNESCDDIHFVWVGGGATYYDSAFYWAEKSIRDRGAEGRVHFLGERTDTEPFFLAADLFLLTSRADPFPCVIQEAMACAVPVISFAERSGAAEAYLDSGVTVPFGVGPMSGEVHALLKDEARLDRLRQRSTELHLAKWPLSEYAEAIFKLAEPSAPIVARKLRMGASSANNVKPNLPQVLIALSAWDYSERAQFAEHAVNLLRQSGHDARLLFTRGTGPFNRGDDAVRLPEVPFSFLYPKTQEVPHVQEALFRHFASSRQETVFVPYDDDGCLDAISRLPNHVSALALLHGEDDKRVEQLRRYAPYFDHIVCTNSSAADDLIDENASLKRNLTILKAQLASDPTRSQAAMAARTGRKLHDPIKVVNCGFGNLEEVLDGVKLARLMREEKVPFKLTLFLSPAEANTVRAVATDLIRGGLLTLLECPAPTERRLVFEQADLLVYGTKAAGSEIGIVEAMAFGCVPIIPCSDRTKQSGLKHEVNCFFFQGAQLRAVTQLMSQLQSNPRRLAALAKETYRTYAKELAGENQFSEALAQACAAALKHRVERQSKQSGKALQLLGSG